MYIAVSSQENYYKRQGLLDREHVRLLYLILIFIFCCPSVYLFYLLSPTGHKHTDDIQAV